MTINRLNYEIYLVDYLDGKLGASQVDELLLFLDQNPDIKEELEGIEDAVLVAETSVFPNKSSLKKKSFLKNGIDNEFDFQCIAATEGLLSNDEKVAFEKSMQGDPIKQNAYKNYQKAKIQPQTAIQYPHKSHLKRTAIIPIRYSYLRASISVAATITLLLGVYTIGKLVIKENHIENRMVVAETVSNSNQNLSAVEIKQPVAVFESHLINEVQQNNIVQTNSEVIIQYTESRIDREEYIPNPIKRKKLQPLETEIDPQVEKLAQIVNKLYPDRQIIYEQLLAQHDESTTFESIQNGVKFISKLFGRDIKLEANKDEKGNVEKITFESKLIAFSTQVKNE